jgi:mannose-6-phosphate isomerase-like protein (cupin superfamily)
MATHYVGKYQADSLNKKHRGWLIGKFMEESPRKTDHVEIKYWEIKPDDNSHPAKTSTIIECTFIIEGHCTAMIDGHRYELHGGDYVVIEPETPSNVLEQVHSFTRGITVKAPSDPTAKKLLGNNK